jgi:arylsulfatase A-like enzyme
MSRRKILSYPRTRITVDLNAKEDSEKWLSLMTRTTRLTILTILVPLVLLSAPLASLLAVESKPAQPNLIIIQTDEHNFRTLGCYRELLPKEQAFVWGDGVAVETPHIDSLAKEGALCDRFYAASPVCTPSRASFVTGRYPQHTGASMNNLPMREGVVTFAEVLRRAGYATGYAGKWHMDGSAKPGWAPVRKFGFEDNRYMFNRGHWKHLEDTPTGPAVKSRIVNRVPNYNLAGADAKSFTTDFLADKTVAFIQAHKNEPFCFMLSIPDPHGPNAVRPPYDTMFEHLNFKRPRSANGNGPMENMARYFGMVKCIDDNVGKILDGLRIAGVLENTIVVFTSDHGDMCGEHGRVNKGVPFEGSARIPFVIAYPGKIKPGMVVHDALTTVDFKPTILNLIGLPHDHRDEGRDASVLFLTGKAPADWKNMAFSRNANGNWLMTVSSRYKFILFPDADPCLFDLDADPFEMCNIFSEPSSRETVRELARALADYSKRCKDSHAQHPAIHADLTWAAEGTGEYAAPRRVKKNNKRRKARNKYDDK